MVLSELQQQIVSTLRERRDSFLDGTSDTTSMSATEIGIKLGKNYNIACSYVDHPTQQMTRYGYVNQRRDKTYILTIKADRLSAMNY